MKLITVLIIMVLTPIAFSQNEWWKGTAGSENKDKENHTFSTSDSSINDSVREPKDIQPGKVNVVKSSSIDKIIKFKAATIPPNMGPIMDGYRIQLFFDQDRNSVDKARSKALLIDSETTTYIEYKAPNYLLLLGDYRSQLEAEKIRSTLISEFPEAIVVEDKIHLPEIKEDEKVVEED